MKTMSHGKTTTKTPGPAPAAGVRNRHLARAAGLLAAGLVLGVAALAAVPARAADDAAAYPAHPIKLVVPFPPGGAADQYARLVGQKLAEAWGQPVVVENKPGAGGQVATQSVARAPADGYTLMVVTVGHAVNPSLYPSLPYDTEKDLVPVAKLATAPSVLVVNTNVPAANIGELLALGRAQPGKLAYGSSGNATTSHVAAAMLADQARLELLHVPYRGSAPAIADLISGQIQMMIDPIVSSAQHVKSGKLRALAITSARRSNLVPELPTLAESGLPDYAFEAWFLLLAPGGTPAAIVDKLNAQVARSLAGADVRERYAAQGAEPGDGSPAELRRFLQAEIRRYAKLVKDSGMKAE